MLINCVVANVCSSRSLRHSVGSFRRRKLGYLSRHSHNLTECITSCTLERFAMEHFWNEPESIPKMSMKKDGRRTKEPQSCANTHVLCAQASDRSDMLPSNLIRNPPLGIHVPSIADCHQSPRVKTFLSMFDVSSISAPS